MKTFADRIVAFNKQLDFSGALPGGISIMNPFKENKNVISISSEFYKKYYNDNNPRYLILGINPGRFGAGITGIPFTDPKRLIEKCEIEFNGELKHEPSSVFVYNVIDAFGGPNYFYQHFYINSVCPLGFTNNKNGKEINYNYYDSRELTNAVYRFIIENLKKQISMGVSTEMAFCFGTGKNREFIEKINEENKFFKSIIALEHPRYVMQYKSKSKQFYIDKFISAFKKAGLG
ncbi:MAG: uracil-DNA glycosylase family protein [Chitinophagaceae bacterium]